MMMMDYILQSFRERVNQMDWLSDLSKQRSIEKVNEIITQAAFPMEIFDNDYVNGIYSRVSNDSSYTPYSLLMDKQIMNDIFSCMHEATDLSTCHVAEF